jgi:hypothetical protein
LKVKLIKDLGRMLPRSCHPFRLKSLSLSSILAGLGAIALSLPTAAAERVILKYSILRESISVAELSTLAKTGEASDSLKAYLIMVNKRPEDLQRVLAYKVNVDPVFLSKMLNSFPGEFMLEQIGIAIHTPSQKSDKQALRGAIVTSAMSDGNLSLIEVLQNYPTEEVHVEGDRLVELYSQLKGMMDGLSRLQF